MPIVLLQLGEVLDTQTESTIACPHCDSKIVIRWGHVPRTIFDSKSTQLIISRYFCETCKHTFRRYPHGIDRSIYSVRLRRLVGLLWLMDLSCRDVEDIFSQLGININRMTIWREGQRLVNNLTSRKILSLSNQWSIEKFTDKDIYNRGSTSLALSLEPGRFTEIGTIVTSNPLLVIAWLKKILEGLDIEVSLLGTNELKNIGNEYCE